MTIERKTLGPYLRSTCACEKCRVPCRTMPGALAPGDLEQIAELLGVAPSWEWVREHFEANEGALVGKLVGTELQSFRVLTISPRLAAGGCVFLTADGRCSIHAASPYGCAMFDMHMTASEGNRRAMACLQAVAADAIARGPYSTTHAALVAAGRISPPLSERRQNCADATEAITGQPALWSESYDTDGR